MERTHSVTVLAQQLQDPSDEQVQDAARELWMRYSADLLRTARRRLAPEIRRRESEEDIVQSMFGSFCTRQRRREFKIDGRDDLWKLLVTLTYRKAANAAKRHSRGRRNVHSERRESGPGGPEQDQWTGAMVLDLVDRQSMPDDAMLLNSELEIRLLSLTPPLRQLVLWKIEGWTNEEIASPDKMNCAVRTVERKLAIIREIWRKDTDSSSE